MDELTGFQPENYMDAGDPTPPAATPAQADAEIARLARMPLGELIYSVLFDGAKTSPGAP